MKTKILVFFIGVSLLVSFSFADARVAQNTVATPELQALAQTIRQQIQEIKEKIILLQEQIIQIDPEFKPKFISEFKPEFKEIKKEIKFTQNLRKGLRGEEVKNLQEFLSQYPDIYPEKLVTGYFGLLTEKAVKKFQEKYSDDILKPFGFNRGTGFVGGRTIAKLNQLMSRDMPQDMSRERRIIICHYPPGNPDARHTIVINESALEAHLALGDTIGPCEDESEIEPEPAPAPEPEPSPEPEPEPEPEPSEEICFDSDDGLNYYVKGILTYGSFRDGDNCKRAIINSNGEFTGYWPVESCEAGDTCYINEGYCDENASYNGKPLGFTTAACLNGCQDGACIAEIVEPSPEPEPEPEPEPQPQDICPNIDGIQETIPIGMIHNNQGDCVVPEPDAILGCTDAAATNYNSEATQDDGTCVYPDTTPPVISNFQPSGTITDITPLLSLNTDENAICRYSITDQSFDVMSRVFAGAGTTFHHVTIEAMVAGTYTYYARCRDVDGNKNIDSASVTFIVITEVADTTAPAISNIQVSDITETSATITWQTNEESDSAVNYWRINSYGLVVSDALAVINHEVNLSNLTSGTIYYYKVNSSDDAGNHAQSSNKIFITLFPAPIPEPEPVDVCPNIYGIQEIIPNGMIHNNEGNCVVPAPDAILGCTDATATNYDSAATQDDGTCVYPDTTAPAISNIQVSDITETSATITWQTNEESDSAVNYGLTANYGLSTTLDTNFVINHTQSLSGLSASTLYHFKVKSKDATGNFSISNDFTFSTIAVACSDMTPYGECSTTKPKYCYNGTLIDNCRVCGCNSGYNCQTNGSCIISSVCGEIIQITTNTADQIEPAIYGDKIVWQDNRNYREIYMYDLSTGQKIQLTNYGVLPDIYGNKIVWSCGVTEGIEKSGIYVYNLGPDGIYGTGDDSGETQLTNWARNTAYQSSVKIYGNKIVWQDKRNGNWDIYMYNLSTGQETQITNNIVDQKYPDVYGNKIVWADRRDGNYDVYMYDLSTGQETQLTTNTAEQSRPAIYGNKIVYTDDRVGKSNIYMYDLLTKQEIWITTARVNKYGARYKPDIYGDKIVWYELYYNGGAHKAVFMYDLSTGQETQVTISEKIILPSGWFMGHQEDPAIYGDKIVWQSNVWKTTVSDDNEDIFMTTICPPDTTLPDTTPPDTTPPTISNIQVSNITQTSATITWQTNEESDSALNYGLSAFYGFTILKGTDTTYHLMNFSNLTAGAVYHYRVKSTDTAGNQAQSADRTFTTLTISESEPDAILGCTDATATNYNSEATQDDGTCVYPDNTPPVISNFQPSGAITDTSPTLSLNTNENAFCKYSTIDQSYDSMPSAFMGAVSTGHYIIFGIMPAGTYTYYARCRDMAGNKNTNSASITFIIPDAVVPIISNIQVSNITQTSATISWQTNEMADSRVDYGLSTFYGFTVSRGTDATHHSFNLSNLTAGATHHYRVKSIDAAGNHAQSADKTFPTPAVPDTTPPTNVADFTAVAVDGRIRLSWTNPIVSWTNPTNSDFAGTKILRKTGSYSSGVTDGTQVYNGTASTYTDIGLINGTKYYYKAFTYDEVPNYSSGAEVFATPIRADVPQFLLKWGPAPPGTSFTSAGRLYRPVGIDVDASGNVYVADTGNYRIQKFTSDGSLIARWGSGWFEWPFDITVDASGNVYVVDANSLVLKFTSDGAFITKWGSKGSGDGQFDSPFGIAVDASGNVYVADIGNHRIQKFTSDGAFITKWGSLGSNDGQFIHPHGITVDASGNVYVADISRSIQKFTSDGVFITKWSSRGSDDGQLKNSRDVAVDASGNVYVMDTGNYRVQKFTSDGLFITKWGSQGSGDGQFDESRGIAVDASGNIYVTDWANHCVQKFVPGQVAALEQEQQLSLIERLLKDIQFQVASVSAIISGLLK